MIKTSLAIPLLWITAFSSSAQSVTPNFVVGLCTHNASDHELDMIQHAGIKAVRDDIVWSNVERDRGVLLMPARYERYVEQLRARGIEPLLILDYGNKLYDGGSYPASEEAVEGFARFAEFVATYFKGRVRHYEIWNEWNYGTGVSPGHPGRPADYVALLRNVYPRLKAIDSNMVVIGGAMSGNGIHAGWLEAACQAGLLDHLDVVSYHPYCWRAEGNDRTPEVGLRKLIEENQAVIEHYARREVPVYLTELGWPNHTGKGGTTPNETTKFLTDSFAVARSFPFIRGIWWYDFRDDGEPNSTDPEHHFGLVSRDLEPKPAFAAIEAVARQAQRTPQP
jgi:polysaccharide biosynthesis protein PslG